MGRVLQLPLALARFGVPYVEIPGWEGRGQEGLNAKAGVAHHVGGAPGLNIILAGRPDLPPPLAQVNLTLDGVCNICASGIANHAGGSGNGAWRGVRGNTFLIGCEADNRPDYVWTDRQIWSYIGVLAAFCWLMGTDESMVCGHYEIAIPPGRKIDPRFLTPALDMGDMRVMVGERLRHPQGPNASEPPIEMEELPAMDSFIAVVTTPSGAKQYYEINKKGGNISVVMMAAETAKGLGTQFFKRGGLTQHRASAAYVTWHVQNAAKHNLIGDLVNKIGKD